MRRKHWEANKILDQVCIACGRANRFHKVFWSPYTNHFVRQSIEINYNGEDLVAATDHYTIFENLELLEWEYEQSIR